MFSTRIFRKRLEVCEILPKYVSSYERNGVKRIKNQAVIKYQHRRTINFGKMRMKYIVDIKNKLNAIILV